MSTNDPNVSTTITPAAETPAPQAETFTYTAADGTVYNATSSEELFKKVTNALNNTKTALKDREHQVHELRQPQQTQPPLAAAYDHKTYLQLLETDGIKAQQYLHTFDQDYQTQQAHAEQTQRETQIRNEVTKFYRDVPEFQQAETPALNQLMRARLEERGRPYTAEALGLTYYELKNEGVIPSGQPAQARRAMPSTPGAGPATPPEEPNLFAMTSKELVAYMKKNKVPGAEYLQ